MLRTQAAIVCGLILTAGLTGCVSPGYEYLSQDLESRTDVRSGGIHRTDGPGTSDIERGRPNLLIDGAGWIIGIPGKILLWDRRVDNHRISPETEFAIAEYIEKNNLSRTKVRLNQYDPLGEWRRLTDNKEVGAGWRYTLGLLATAGYTILPGRIIGGDNYNPFTNTINIYSDHPAIALHEGGHAKDIRSRSLPGTYSAAYTLPFVALYHEEKATSDVLSYLNAEDRSEEMREAYKILYPAYGTHVAGQFNNFIPPPFDFAVTAACVIPGHVAGRIQAARVEDRDSLSTANPFEASPSFQQMGRESVAVNPAPLFQGAMQSSMIASDLD